MPFNIINKVKQNWESIIIGVLAFPCLGDQSFFITVGVISVALMIYYYAVSRKELTRMEYKKGLGIACPTEEKRLAEKIRFFYKARNLAAISFCGYLFSLALFLIK